MNDVPILGTRFGQKAAQHGMEPTPLGVEQDRCDFEGWHRLDTRTDLDGGAAHAQAVGPPFTSADVTPQPACAILQQVRLLHEYVCRFQEGPLRPIHQGGYLCSSNTGWLS